MAVKFMHEEKAVSVKLAGAKAIIKYTRKLSAEAKTKALKEIITIIDDLEQMLTQK